MHCTSDLYGAILHAALNSFSSAERHYQAALELWPEDDSEWPLLVVATSDVGGLSVSAVRMTELLPRAPLKMREQGDLDAEGKMLACPSQKPRRERNLGGSLAAGAHFTKAGARALINTSPEPFSNWAASFGEELAVGTMLWLAFTHPIAAGVVVPVVGTGIGSANTARRLLGSRSWVGS